MVIEQQMKTFLSFVMVFLLTLYVCFMTVIHLSVYGSKTKFNQSLLKKTTRNKRLLYETSYSNTTSIGNDYWLSDTGDILEHGSFTVSSNGTKLFDNIMWNVGEPASSGSHYWTVHLHAVSNTIVVGISNKKYFLKGVLMKCLCFGGHLENGESVLISHFGLHISMGDSIGILAVYDSTRLRVYFDVNGRSLGKAYDVPSTLLTEVYPVIQFHGVGSVSCRKYNLIPNKREREKRIYGGIKGPWILKQLLHCDEHDCQTTYKLIKRQRPTIFIHEEDNDIKINLFVESFRGFALKLESLESTNRFQLKSSIKSNSLDVSFENDLLRTLNVIGNMTLTGDLLTFTNLFLTSVWARDDRDRLPFHGNPFI